MKCQGTLNWRRKRLLCRDCLVWGKVLCSTAWCIAWGWMCLHRAAPLAQCIKGVCVQPRIWGCYNVESGCATTGNTGGAEEISISLSLCLQIQPCVNSKTLPSTEGIVVKTVHGFPVFVQWPSQLVNGHQTSPGSNVTDITIKRSIRAFFPACPPRGRLLPASALKMSGREHELLERINYFCYLQMDQISNRIWY